MYYKLRIWKSGELNLIFIFNQLLPNNFIFNFVILSDFENKGNSLFQYKSDSRHFYSSINFIRINVFY